MEPNVSQKQKSEAVVDFMLMEYQTLVDYRKLEIERGQNYVNLFLALTSGAAALLALMSQVALASFRPLGITILLMLLMLGIILFVEMLHRDIRITSHVRGLGRIRHYFVEIEPNIQPYLSYPPYDDKPYKHVGLDKIGLRSIVTLMNGFLGTALTYLMTYTTYEFRVSITTSITVFCVLLILQGAFANVYYHTAEQKAEIHFPSGHNKQKGSLKEG